MKKPFALLAVGVLLAACNPEPAGLVGAELQPALELVGVEQTGDVTFWAPWTSGISYADLVFTGRPEATAIVPQACGIPGDTELPMFQVVDLEGSVLKGNADHVVRDVVALSHVEPGTRLSNLVDLSVDCMINGAIYHKWRGTPHH